MKKLLFILSIISVLGIISCDDKLGLEPWQSASTDGVFTSIEDFDNGIRGVFTELHDWGAYGGALFIYPDVAADNLIQCRDGRLTLTTVQNWTYASDYYMANAIWSQFYDALNNCNLVIENLVDFEVDEDDQVLKNQYLGEAYALRALLHYELVKVFGKAYSQASASDLGVPYMLESNVGTPERETVISNYNNIVADLTQAISLVTIDDGRFRMSPAAVNAIFAQVDMEMGNYGDAITHATACLADRPICSRTNFEGVWTDDVADGGVLYVQVTEQDEDGAGDQIKLGTDYSQTSATSGTKSEYVIDYDLYQQYAATDIRLDAYITTSVYNGTMYNHIKKYMQKTGSSTPDLVDLKVIRAAEVLLIRAEANYRDGNPGSALNDLNDLRAERYSGFVDGTESGAALLNAILLERRLELAFEGDRFFTLKRLGQSVARNGSYGDHADGTGDLYNVLNLSVGDYRFEMPIPLSEMNANPNMVQNSGY